MTDDVLRRARRHPAARARSACAARRTWSPRRWSPRCSATARAGCTTCRRSATSRWSAGCWSCTASRSPTAPRTASWSSTRPTSRRANVDEINVHAGSSRIPILFCGPLLHRLGHAFIPDLGGCHIGDRPIDFHLAGAARVRRDRREDAARGCTCTAPERAARHQVRAAVPERRRDRAGAADRRAAPRASPSCATPPSSRRSST